jgi:multicomponent K+:H+ antiporter subunit D
MTVTSHGPVVPLLLPLVAGLLLIALGRAPLAVQRGVAAAATLAQLAAAVVLFGYADAGAQLAYAVGDWAAPFGIFLLVDRLSAWMLVLTAVVACGALLYACAGEDRGGPWFHALFQFQLLGINGVFLTADLFNLFVFFEVLLVSSYALLLHGGGAARVRAALHVVVLNLVGSALFLVGVACVYAATGTLSLADLAIKAPAVSGENAPLLRTGALLLLVVFALKAAAAPLGFWLPRAYAAAPAAVAALFALLTKVGVYAMLRLYTIAFPCFDVGPCGPSGLVLPLGLATSMLGAIGALAASRLRPLAGCLMLVSLGTLLVATGTFRAAGEAAAVYYLAHGTLAGAAMFVVADLIARQRARAGDRLDAAEPVRDVAPLAVLFAVASIAIVGLPPLSGFVGKVAVLQSTAPDAPRVWAIVLMSTLFAVIAVARAASALFWRTGPAGALSGSAPAIDGGSSVDMTHAPARSSALVAAPWPARAAAWLFVAALVLLTVAAGPAFEYANATARQLVERRGYVDAVFGVGSLSAPPDVAPAVPPPALAEAP